MSTIEGDKMSTIKGFENAPVGATATHSDGRRAMKMADGERRWITPTWICHNDEEMARRGYARDLPAPATAREALALAWELAHPVKEGQVIPGGSRFLEFHNSVLKEYIAYGDREINFATAPITRTLDPLPDPEPDWLNAPAILASHPLCADTEPVGLWIPVTGSEGRWEWPHGEFESHWSELEDVTPLYPKGQDA